MFLRETLWEGNYLDLEYPICHYSVIHTWLICWVKSSSLEIIFFPNFGDFPVLLLRSPFWFWIFLCDLFFCLEMCRVFFIVPVFWNFTTYIVKLYFHLMRWVFRGPFNQQIDVLPLWKIFVNRLIFFSFPPFSLSCYLEFIQLSKWSSSFFCFFPIFHMFCLFTLL